MKLFFSVVSKALRQQLVYRTAMWAGLATNLFFGLLRAAVILALYDGQDVVNGLPVQSAIAFVGITQGLIAFTTIFGSYDIIRSVYSGDISSDLLRPMNFFLYWMSKDLGVSIVNLVGRGILFMVLFSLFYPIQVVQGGLQVLAFILAMTLSWLASFSWRFLVNLTSFWTPDAVGIGRGLFGLVQVLSGFFIPLRLLPDWFRAFCDWTPFPAMINTPVEVYLGVLTDHAMWNAILFQMVWLILLIVVGQVVFHAGVRRLVIQGG